MTLIEFGERTVEHGLADDELADEIHDGVDAGSFDAKAVFGDGGDGGACAGLLRCGIFFRVGRVGGDLRGLGIEKVAEKFVVESFGGGGAFETHVGNDGRNFTTLENALFGLNAGNRGFDDFDGGSSDVIFRAECDHRAGAVKNIANELEGGGAHEAVGIDAQGDVVNGVAAMHGFRNHQLLVLGPGKFCGNFLRGRLRFARGRSGKEQAANHGVESFHGGRIDAALVSGEHGFEAVRGGEDDFSKLGAAGLRDVRSEHVFEFVSEFAEFVKAAGGGIALERVHGAADAANDGFVGGTRFELEAGFVERLQQFAGALEKESAKLGAAIFGRTAQGAASILW